MEHKLKCEVCQKKFDSKRATAKYCSESCKQKAHYKRLADNQESTEEEGQTEVFYLDEYAKIDWSIYFVRYCFFRRHLPKDATLQTIEKYISSMHMMNEHFMEFVAPTKAFREFNERFLAQEFKVLPNRFVDGKDIYGTEVLEAVQ
ncbi:hypothetical protein [Emticicia sp. 17c]|uniref:hypothetical protein n=1 Tax=Emticicia sp. 17c TaxID=3127704 RepID=UPI00301E5DDE